jgi:hypothetical protein
MSFALGGAFVSSLFAIALHVVNYNGIISRENVDRFFFLLQFQTVFLLSYSSLSSSSSFVCVCQNKSLLVWNSTLDFSPVDLEPKRFTSMLCISCFRRWPEMWSSTAIWKQMKAQLSIVCNRKLKWKRSLLLTTSVSFVPQIHLLKTVDAQGVGTALFILGALLNLWTFRVLGVKGKIDGSKELQQTKNRFLFNLTLASSVERHV